MVSNSPAWLLGLPPVMEAEHDGEGAGGQHLLVVIVVQTVGCCQSKSVTNLGRNMFNDKDLMHYAEDSRHANHSC